MITNFHIDLARSAPYEIIVANELSKKRKLIDVRDNKDYQSQDIDYLTEEGHGLEIKIDFTNYQKTNLVVEIISNLENNKPGFLYYSRAKWFAFYFPNKKPGEIYLIPRLKLIKYIENNKNKLKIIENQTKIKNNLCYTSIALLVPVDDLFPQIVKM